MSFQIENIEPAIYRKKSRNATLIMMAIFIVIGFICAQISVEMLGEYNNNKIVLSFMGAFVGLAITAWITKTFLANKPVMYEAMYGFRLKRNLMHVSNKLRPIKEAAEAGDTNAMRCLRFYHLGLSQMHKFDQNSVAQLDLKVEMEALERKMSELELELNQTTFDPAWVEDYANDAQDD